MIKWEFKKLLKSKVAIISAILFIMLCSFMGFLKPTLETENSYRDKQYKLIIDNRPKEVIANEKFNVKFKKIEQLAEIKTVDASLKKMADVSKKTVDSIKYKEYKDVDFYKVLDYRVAHPLVSIIMVVILVMIFCNIYVDEKITSVDNIILSSKNKFKTLNAKLFMAAVLPVVTYGVYIGAEFIITLIQYKMPVNGGLEAFRILENGPFLNYNYSINQFLLLKILTMSVIFISIGVFSSFFSFVSNNSLTTVSGISIFILLGKILSILPVFPSKLLDLLGKSNYIELLFYYKRFIGLNIGNIEIFNMIFDIGYLSNGILIFVTILGIVLCKISFRKIIAR
ncbi:hypothetical protein ACER0A_000885 [Haloimpatiens sp. FM7315]|uniref:hypothetical protein n=1 Tax=Haloimpatiens sp. FM7315 TaxID=3298609 RepID=UPI0035A2F653